MNTHCFPVKCSGVEVQSSINIITYSVCTSSVLKMYLITDSLTTTDNVVVVYKM